MLGTGYKLRQQISKALQRCSEAVQKAITQYNAQAATLDPPRPSITWKDITNYTVLGEFDLLRYSQLGVHGQHWSQLAYREATVKYFKLHRAHEEVVRLNVEVRRLRTAIHDEDKHTRKVISELLTSNPPLGLELQQQYRMHAGINAVHLRRLDKIEKLPEYTGVGGIGVRLQPIQVDSPTSGPPDDEISTLFEGNSRDLSTGNIDQLYVHEPGDGDLVEEEEGAILAPLVYCFYALKYQYLEAIKMLGNELELNDLIRCRHEACTRHKLLYYSGLLYYRMCIQASQTAISPLEQRVTTQMKRCRTIFSLMCYCDSTCLLSAHSTVLLSSSTMYSDNDVQGAIAGLNSYNIAEMTTLFQSALVKEYNSNQRLAVIRALLRHGAHEDGAHYHAQTSGGLHLAFVLFNPTPSENSQCALNRQGLVEGSFADVLDAITMQDHLDGGISILVCCPGMDSTQILSAEQITVDLYITPRELI
ncbi:hypothetical protein JVT61DRAFT_14428 [Boletus reticuloceps]|uniref:Uncharacterized protein n=1 Tax=Boletus reticuloceps TaxID=495285 RepID=A0A8I3AA75_9AGAM|nr:hypothetical protein JVT61DRAFT_14428 [Boletus reticuloceps]